MIQTNNSMSSINSQTHPFPQNNKSIQRSGLTYFVNNVSFEIIKNLKRFHILIPNLFQSSIYFTSLCFKISYSTKYLARPSIATFHVGKYIDLMFVLCECDDKIIKKFLESVTKDTIIYPSAKT